MQKITHCSKLVPYLQKTSNTFCTDSDMQKIPHFQRYQGLCVALPGIVKTSWRNALFDRSKLWKLLGVHWDCWTKWYQLNVLVSVIPIKKKEKTWQNQVDSLEKSSVHQQNSRMVQWYAKKDLEQTITRHQKAIQKILIKVVTAHYDSTSCCNQHSASLCSSQLYQVVYTTNRLQP